MQALVCGVMVMVTHLTMMLITSFRQKLVLIAVAQDELANSIGTKEALNNCLIG